MKHVLHFLAYILFLAIFFPVAICQAVDVQKEFAFPRIDDVLHQYSQAGVEFREVVQTESRTVPAVDETDVSVLLRLARQGGPNASVIVMALGEMNTSAATEALLEIIQEINDQALTYTALDALSRSDSTLAVPQMIALLDSPKLDTTQKAVILGELWKHPGAEVEAAALKCASHPDLERFAISTLGEIGTERTLTFLRHYLETRTGEKMPVAEYALRRIESRLNAELPNDSISYLNDTNQLETHIQVEDDARPAVSTYAGTIGSYPVSDSTSVGREHQEALEELLRRAREIELVMEKIQKQAFETGGVREAMDKYSVLIQDAIRAQKNNNAEYYRSMTDEQTNELLYRCAMRDEVVLAAHAEVFRLLRQESTTIEPQAEALGHEYQILVNKIIRNYIEKESEKGSEYQLGCNE